jgi:SAM-dependent methyltransferase
MNSSHWEKEKPRIESMLSRFLIPMLDPSWSILSVGCGAGSDVLELRRRGFNAWGIDPSRLTVDHLPENKRAFFYIGTMEEAPFADKRFDFIYALDVIEHVGCIEFGTRVQHGTAEARKVFLVACYNALKPGGTLLMTTSNRLCLVDMGHWHSYHWLGRQFSDRKKFGLSIPWDKRNFLLSTKDIQTLLDSVVGFDRFRMENVKTALYPTLQRKGAIRWFLRLVDLPGLIGSPLAPILIVKITKG